MGGKKKQKVKWCAVDGLKWSTNEDESSPEGSVTGKENAGYTHQQNQYSGGHGNYNGGQGHYNGGHHGQGHYGGGQGNYGGQGRRQSQPWLHNGVAPRFDRRSQGGQRQVYYDGEYCDAEEMPNGFTKIRSKNLDILFKRNYYEHRPAKAKEEGVEETPADPTAPQPTKEPVQETTESQPTAQESKPFRSCKSFDQIDPSEIPEFRPMNSMTTSVASDPETELNSGEVSPPYYPPYYTDQGGYNYSTAPPRPNLYLYSPTNNTLIPCEEIIIPAEGGGPAGTPYPGPANIYLAYPVQGPDGRGYITQQFSPPIPGEPYLSYPCYSPSMSLDGSQYQSSTPQTPNSGQESGSSTQPTSPPPLLNYHPANWFHEQHTPANTQEVLPNRTAEPVTQGVARVATSVRSDPAKPAVVETPTLQYIPGLPPVDTNTKKKSQKKKKTKKPAAVTAAAAGHRGSVSSDCSGERVSSAADMSSSPYGNSPVVEVNLTDDLADYLVNPPTDPEVSDEETTLTLVSGAAENIPCLPRDDTICNLEESLFLEDLPMEENLGEVAENLVDDSVIEKDLEVQQTQIKSSTDASIEASLPPAEQDCATQEELCNIQVETCSFIQESVLEPVQTVQDPAPVPHVQASFPTVHESAPLQIVVEPSPVQTAQDSPAVETAQVSLPAVIQDIPSEIPVVEAVLESLGEKETVKVVEPVSEVAKTVAPQATVEEPIYVPGKAKKKKTKRKNTEMKPANPTVLEPLAPLESQDIPTDKSSKMSYSAVCRTSDPRPSRPTQPLPQSVPTQPKGQNPQVEAAEESTKVEPPKEEEWETLPPALVSNPGQWEKKDRKRKKKGGTVVAFDDVPQVFEEKVEVEEATIMPELETVKAPAEKVEDVKESALVEEDAEEKKRVRKKKKKHAGSQEPEDAGHRVIIHDNQVEIRVTRVVRRASDVLGSSQMEEVRRSGYLDFLVVDQLGSGISRGCIHNGRLYQGKYVPPARVDGLLPPKDEEVEMEEGEEPLVKDAEEIDLD